MSYAEVLEDFFNLDAKINADIKYLDELEQAKSADNYYTRSYLDSESGRVYNKSYDLQERVTDYIMLEEKALKRIERNRVLDKKFKHYLEITDFKNERALRALRKLMTYERELLLANDANKRARKKKVTKAKDRFYKSLKIWYVPHFRSLFCRGSFFM